MAEGQKVKKGRRKRRERGRLHLTQESSSGIWYIRGTVRGRRVRESTGTCDAQTADAIRVKREAELLAESVHGRKVVATFAECVEHYLTMRDGGGNRRFLAPLVTAFGHVKARDINTLFLQQYVERTIPNHANTSKNVMVINPTVTVLRCAARAGLCDVPVIDRYEERPQKITGPGEGWLQEFMAKCDRPKILAYVLLLTTTGCRGIDACRLRSEHVNREAGTAYLPETKNGESRTLQLSPAILDLLTQFEHSPCGRVFGFSRTDVANHEISDTCKRIGVPYVSGHRLGRHAFAERLLNAGHTIQEVAKAGGWRDYVTLAKRYGHLEQSKVDEIVRNQAATVVRGGLRVVK